MKVKSIITQNSKLETQNDGKDIFLLVDGGFVVVCLNLLKITSYDVVFPSKEKPKALEQIIAGISKKLADSQTDQEQRRHLAQKITLLNQLLEL